MSETTDRESPSAMQACPLCGGEAALKFTGHPGYREPARYDIYDCAQCDTRFAHPLVADWTVYDLIYRHIEDVRGYARYARYARTVATRKDPLGYLAGEEDVYWAIAQFVRELPRSPPPRLLEIGSGLGYLTYSIARSGYSIRGLDISAVAVEGARKRFGDLYDCGDVRRIADSAPESVDAVLMTELIEHLPDPMELVHAAMRLVRPGGHVVFTTPNKSGSAAHALWDTDSPPVHLWWFSERSAERIAARAGASLRLIDFTEFNRTHENVVESGPEMAAPTVPAVFDANGALIDKPSVLRSPARRAWFALGLDALPRTAEARRAAAKPPSSRRKTLCAILSKPR
jgi:SAM-dependent methyltransferase